MVAFESFGGKEEEDDEDGAAGGGGAGAAGGGATVGIEEGGELIKDADELKLEFKVAGVKEFLRDDTGFGRSSGLMLLCMASLKISCN
jgi:hypothetical protein